MAEQGRLPAGALSGLGGGEIDSPSGVGQTAVTAATRVGGDSRMARGV